MREPVYPLLEYSSPVLAPVLLSLVESAGSESQPCECFLIVKASGGHTTNSGRVDEVGNGLFLDGLLWHGCVTNKE